MGKKRSITYPRRGEVYLARFDPAHGAEIRKTRPALIVQNDIGNRHSPITIVAAITSNVRSLIPRYQVLVRAPEGGLDLDCVVALNQLRTVDKTRLVRRIGRLKPSTILQVNDALRISLGLIEL